MVVDFLKRVVTFAGRSIEFALTGQTEYAVITAEEMDFKCVTDTVKGRRVLAEAQALLARDYGIRLCEPVLLEMFSGKDFTPASLRYVLKGSVGSYLPARLGKGTSHLVRVLSGMTRGRFKAIAAHELIHAYEREAGILQTHRGLREGFARWIEYRVLVAENETREAKKLLRLRSWRAGKSIHQLLDIEKREGTAGVLKFVHAVG